MKEITRESEKSKRKEEKENYECKKYGKVMK